MPEQLEPNTPQQSHAQNLRQDAVRRLSRSPHPYHRQQYELTHGLERFSTSATWKQPPLNSTQATDDEGQEGPKSSEIYRSGNSDSGTEADDEHFLKGLPAPKLRPHKGLRGVDQTPSGSPSPLLSPAILDENFTKAQGFFRRATTPSKALDAEQARQAADKLHQRRKAEVVRRTTEAGILVFVGLILSLDPGIRHLIYSWRRELGCQLLVTSSLIIAYPLRLLRHINIQTPWKRPFPLAVPASFDPAPLIYPPSIPLLVSLILSRDRSIALLPSVILGISSLPKHLIPSTGGYEGSNISHWFLSCLPLLLKNSSFGSNQLDPSNLDQSRLKPEVLVLLYPLHQALCITLHSLTTTSLLPAELQLLSTSLINLLLLASSPQAIILKALLWGGGIGVLVSCGHVLKWGVVLARVPKWRFRRAGQPANAPPDRGWALVKRAISFGVLGKALAKRDSALVDSSEDEGVGLPLRAPGLKINTQNTKAQHISTPEDGTISALEPKVKHNFTNGTANLEQSFARNRRHTLPSLTNLPPRSSKRTPAGRRKRAASSSMQGLFALTQQQATIRKWLYAIYVYACILAIILIGIRQYVETFALYGNEPIGWALGYLFGDLPEFRMNVISYNFQRWICLPPYSTLSHTSSCHLGKVQHLRLSSFGTANTRLILCAYWLAIIITGLLIVLRLSSIYEVDTRRKVFHFMMVFMLLPATYVDPTFAALSLSLILAIFLLLDLFRASQLPPLSKSLAYFLTPYVDGRDLKGPVVISHIFLLIGSAIPLWLSLASLPRSGSGYLKGWEIPTREVSMVSGVICVGLGDAFASLIGRRFGRRKWLWGGGKSIEGSLAFATAVAIALCLAKFWLRIGGWPANNDDVWWVTGWKSGLAAGVASLTEAVLTGGNDNVVVPVVLWVCVKGLDI